MEQIKLYSTRGTKHLAKKVVDLINIKHPDWLLNTDECVTEEFANGELTVQYNKSVRDKRIFLIGETTTNNIMELLLMIDAAKRASAKEIIIVLPSYGYSRSDKIEGIRGPLAAKLVADLLQAAGAGSIITIDLHASQIQGFFNIPVNHISGHSFLGDSLIPIITNKEDYIIISPDQGGFLRAAKFAKKLGLHVAAIHKVRDKPGSIESMHLLADVANKHIILIDDIVDSAGTLCKAADYLVNDKNALSVVAVCTHPILSGKAIENITKTDNLKELIVSDTIELSDEAKKIDKIKIISSAPILARIIGRVETGRSINEINS